MPKIPTSQRRIQDQVFQSKGVRASAPGVGTTPGIGQQLNQIVEGVNNIYEEERQKADTTAVKEYDNQLTRIRNKYTLQYRENKGKNAIENYNSIHEQYQKEIDELDKQYAKNDRLKERLGLVKEDHKTSFLGSTDSHLSGESQRYQESVYISNLESINEDAALNYKEYSDPNNPKKLDSLIAKQEASVIEYAKSKGMDDKQIEAEKLNASSAFHANVVRSALNNGDDLLAKEYYKRAKKRGEIDGDTALKLDKVLHSSNIKGESQRQADRIIAANLGMGESLAEARKIKDPEVRDATVDRVRNRLNENKLIAEDKSRRDFESAVEEFEKYKTIDHLPEEEKLAIAPKKMAALQRVAAGIARGEQPKTDPIVYQDLKLMAANPITRDKFLRTDINESMHKLSNQDRKELLNLQKSLRDGKGSADKELRGFLSDSAIVNKTLDELNITDKKKRARFNQLVNEQAIVWKQRNGKADIPQSELKNIADTLLLEVEVEGFFFDPDKRLFEVRPDETIKNIDYDSIPESARVQLKRAFEVKGKPFDEKEAAELYKKYIASK